MLIGIGVATAITAVIQSSGATIGMVFAMISAGVITRVEEAYPIILGANIGTCATAMLGSIGAPVAARRSALSHLFFNIFSAVFGIITAPLIFRYIHYTAPIQAGMNPEAVAQALIHQCANANTIKMVLSALLALPAVTMLASFVRRIAPQRGKPEEASYLDPDLLNRPEDALQAALSELIRLTRLCRKGLTSQAALFIQWDRSKARSNQEIERTLDTIKISMHDYLLDLTAHRLSRRQGILLTLLYHGVDHLERISDHLDHMSQLSTQKRHVPAARFDKNTVESLFALNRQAHQVLLSLEEAMLHQPKKKSPPIEQIMHSTEIFKEQAELERTTIGQELSGRKTTPVAALYRGAFLSDLSRIVKHARALALEMETRDFHIKKKKLGREIVAESPLVQEN